MRTVRRSGILAVSVSLACAVGLGAVEKPAGSALAQSWIESPYHRFGPAQSLLPGRAALFDEADDPVLKSALAAELRRLFAELYSRQGWRSPFSDDELLRIYVARREGTGFRQLAARGVEKGKLVSPAVLIDGDHLSDDQIVREVSRQIAAGTLAAYGVADDAFLTAAAASALAARSGAPDEDLALVAAAPELDLRAHPAVLGRAWVEEILREPEGPTFFRQVWERAAASGEAPLPLLLRAVAESGARSEETLLARCAARVYVGVETETAPSRLRLFDLEAGALDAAAPASMSIRHRSFLPAELEESLRVAWPEDGGAGAAVVRYRDAELPPDVVFFGAGDVRTISLSGVARVDWIVAGSSGGGRGIRAPVSIERSTGLPFSGLESHAAASADGVQIRWTTATHRGLWGWAIFREEVLADGRIARTGPGIVPSSESAEESFGYAFLDEAAAGGTFYRYTVWAVTDEGLLARAFSATLKTPD